MQQSGGKQNNKVHCEFQDNVFWFRIFFSFSCAMLQYLLDGDGLVLGELGFTFVLARMQELTVSDICASHLIA
jgi:hypothetical protein